MKRLKAKIEVSHVLSTGVLVLFLMGLWGCQNKGGLSTTQPDKDLAEKKADAEKKAASEKSAPLEGTIGSASYVEGMRTMFVQGYGLVMGLSGTGSSECPQQLRDSMMNTIAKYQHLYGVSGGKPSLQAGEILDSRNTAVVKVSGFIPAGTSKGDHFDLTVEALANTGTTSIEGGRLFSTELRIYSEAFSGDNNTSRILADGAGAIFINPFEKKQKRGSLLLKRKGYVLNGGTSREDRRLHLVLYQPSYGTSRTIEQKINSFFGPPPDDPLWQTAKAVGPDRIELHIPREYRDQLDYFLGLVQNMYIRSDPTYIESRANELTRQVSDPVANTEAISYAWEAMGRSMLSLIQPLYADSNRQTAFYAARAGSMMGDTVAMEQIGKEAMDPKSQYRKKSIITLGGCKSVVARRFLRKLTDDPDISIRILAYEGLAKQEDGTIDRRFVGADNLILDVLHGKKMPMVYVTRSGEPKIVLFGDIRIDPPVFYCHPDDSITLSADAGSQTICLIRKSASGQSSGRMTAGLDLPPLIGFLGNDAVMVDGKVTGLDLPYSHIVAILNQLCKDGALAARFKLQDLADLPDTEDALGRPEKD
jgi:flagellar basal body P-ring protein FlgI